MGNESVNHSLTGSVDKDGEVRQPHPLNNESGRGKSTYKEFKPDTSIRSDGIDDREKAQVVPTTSSSAIKAKEIIKQLMKDGSIWEEIIQKALDDASRYTIDIDYSKYISKKKVLEIIDSIKNWDRNCPLKKELVEKIKEEFT